MQASNAFASAGAAAPDEFYDLYTAHLEPEGQWARARRRFFRHRLAVASLIILAVVFAAGFLSPRIAPYGYEEVNIQALSSGPSWAHPFGTDQIGRDYFSRTLLGLRTEAAIALLIGFFGTVIGTLVGAAAGYMGRTTDMIFMRLADLLLTVPPLVTVLVAAAFFETDTLFEVALLLCCLLWMPLARVVRATALVLREQEYVQAALAMGASDGRILRRHILPNAVSTVAVAASVMIATAVILETTLSYLGLGLGGGYGIFGGRTNTKLPSVGDVLAAASSEGFFNWWGIVFPGIVVILIVAPIYFIGDGVRDAFDPTQRRYVSKREVARRRRGPSRPTRWVRALPRPELNVRVRMPARVHALVDALPRRRHVAKRRLWLEALAVLGLTAVGAVAVYVWNVNPVRSEWSLAGENVQNVSRAAGAQTQVSVAADPAHSGVLLAASNDSQVRTVHIYTSTDDGRTWTSVPGPSLGERGCARGDPSAAIDARGRQYVAFTVGSSCTQDDQTPYVVVTTRPGLDGGWSVTRLGPQRPQDFWDDRPNVAAGPDGRVYVVWSRLLRWNYEGIVVSSSADREGPGVSRMSSTVGSRSHVSRRRRWRPTGRCTSQASMRVSVFGSPGRGTAASRFGLRVSQRCLAIAPPSAQPRPVTRRRFRGSGAWARTPPWRPRRTGCSSRTGSAGRARRRASTSGFSTPSSGHFGASRWGEWMQRQTGSGRLLLLMLRPDGCGLASTTRVAIRAAGRRGSRARARATDGPGQDPSAPLATRRARRSSGKTRASTRTATSSASAALRGWPPRGESYTRCGSTHVIAPVGSRRSSAQHCVNSLLIFGRV